MIKETLILAGGKGEKFWPFQSTRNKTMIPISNTPLLVHTVDALFQCGMEHIVIVSATHSPAIRNAFRKQAEVDVVEIAESKGSAETFLQGLGKLKDPTRPFFVLHGDCLVQAEDLVSFLSAASLNDALVFPLREPSTNWIACRLDQGKVVDFGGHHRGNLMTHQLAGFITDKSFATVCEVNPGKFTNLKVGVGSPTENYIEVSLMDAMADGSTFNARIASQPVFDIDKPWHAMEANVYMNQKRCSELKSNELADGAAIDPTARIDGFVRLGKNSKIGKNVWIRGNAIIGDDTLLDQGCIVGENVVIGDKCSILNHAKLGDNSTLGHRCMMDQGFELLTSVILDHVYLVHYGEYYGMIGENTDLGAGTTCGTLRFDDGLTVQSVKGRKETPTHFANASYIGDNSRTGVCAVLMPGVKVGSNSVVASGVVLNEDLADQTLIYAKQDTVKVPWGPEKYGW